METFWNIERHPDFSEVVCEVGGQKILLGDLKTLRPTMSSREQEVMRTFSSKFIGVGWLNGTTFSYFPFEVSAEVMRTIVSKNDCSGQISQRTKLAAIIIVIYYAQVILKIKCYC